MRFESRIVALLVGAAVAVPPPASAQVEDPDAGSPSGTVYEIPLEDGRGDAAPRDPKPGTAGTPASPIHTEDNGFGSSSTVPGTAPQTPAPPAGQSGAAAPDPTAGPGANRQPEDAQSEIQKGDVVRQTADASPSLGRAGLLLGLGVLVAAGLAVAVRLVSRQR
jgi:hypothetical protein